MIMIISIFITPFLNELTSFSDIRGPQGLLTFYEIETVALFRDWEISRVFGWFEIMCFLGQIGSFVIFDVSAAPVGRDSKSRIFWAGTNYGKGTNVPKFFFRFLTIIYFWTRRKKYPKSGKFRGFGKSFWSETLIYNFWQICFFKARRGQWRRIGDIKYANYLSVLCYLINKFENAHLHYS